jgi:hypothetical protein
MSPEPVGSLAEEAARFVSVLASLSPGHGFDDREADDAHGRPAGGAAGGPADGPADAAHDPYGPECRFCPLCSLARAARTMTPEVREHLASAAGSLMLAVRGMLDEAMTRPDRDEQPVEKIDLAED